MDAASEDWSAQVEALRPRLLMLARQMVQPKLWKDVDPSGVVQETLLEAQKRPDPREHDGPVALDRWVRRILRNNLLDRVRQIRRQCRTPERQVRLDGSCEATEKRILSDLGNDEPSPSEIAVKKEELQGLAAALEKLDPLQQEVLTLRHLKGYSLSELAQHLGRSESAAAALLHRALEKLKALLKKE